MELTVQVRKRGTLTLPAEPREKYGIKPGDTFHLVDLDGVFILTPMRPWCLNWRGRLSACARGWA